MNAPQFQRPKSLSVVPRARLFERAVERRSLDPTERLAEYLVLSGRISEAQLLQAGHLARTHQLSVPKILVAEGWVSEDALLEARCECFNATHIRLATTPADPLLLREAGLDWCLKHRIIPWRRLGGRIVWITANPELFDQAQADLPLTDRASIVAVASEEEIENTIAEAFSNTLLDLSETGLAQEKSCRNWSPPHAALILLIGACVAMAATTAPAPTIATLLIGAVFVVAVNVVLKAVLAYASLRRCVPAVQHTPNMPLPRISILVPLLREAEVAAKLLNNLERLRYPRGLLEIIFIVEREDDVTKSALSHQTLPYTFRTIEVPSGSVTTKPRALNYALQFCRGEIVGIYDAEDKPEPNQLLKVAEGFRNAAPDVACLQGRLDFFNTRSGLLTRCFTTEYAGWFGLQLKGLSRLGWPVPLGGTTLFIRRDVLDLVGCWDAYNVTEDADLGLRLHRAGYRTDLVDTVTDEEATSTPLSWIRQRSRWIKGYILTYAVHMRRPRELRDDLGACGFWAFQALFLGSVLGALTMPVLLVTVAVLFGAEIPGVSPKLFQFAGGTMLLLEIVNLAIWAAGIRAPRHRHLFWVLPLLHIYYFMASLAALKALAELLAKPFFWDKTRHGVTGEDTGC